MKLTFALPSAAGCDEASEACGLLRPLLRNLMRPFRIWIPVLLVAISTGCGQNDIRVYRVAKETAPPEQVAAVAPGSLPPGHPDISAAGPGLKWKLPAGWESVAPGEMRLASFRVNGKDGKQADVSIIQLPGIAGGDLNNVNRWRSQVGQPPVSEADLTKAGQAVQIAGQPAQLYDIAGKNPSSDEKTRILAAILHRDDSSWFFKMVGDDELVMEQKTAFIEFLESLSFAPATTSLASELPPSHPPIDASGAAPVPSPSAGSADEGRPKWQVPAGWQETSAGQFLVAKFLIAGADKTPTAVNVSKSAGDGGGLAANANRWRNQLGLPPLAQAELEKQVKTLEVPGAKEMLVDMSGTDGRTGQASRLVGAILPGPNATWFYKLMGEPQVVAREKDAFVKFVQSAASK